MSVINKMHQDLNTVETNQPVISSAQSSNKKQKMLLGIGISALALCAVFLLLQILLPSEQANINAAPSKGDMSGSDLTAVVETTVQTKSVLQDNIQQVQSVETMSSSTPNPLYVKPVQAKSESNTDNSDDQLISAVVLEKTNNVSDKKISSAEPRETAEVKKSFVKDHASTHKASTDIVKVQRKATSKTNSASRKPAVNSVKSGELKIEPAKLSSEQLSAIYLKEAEKARAKDDHQLAAQKWQKALNVKPDLNHVRKSLASYYYTLGENDRAARVLKKGALISPEYSDFNLMLARLSLKQGDQQRAYLYLEQNPPKVQGHLDYYATHAALAQKFEQYPRAEQLYQAMLTQRPNSGRWWMSLAISQDKQAKKNDAISAYEKALQQSDLSSKAKDYIKKRLAYLGKE